MQKNIYALKDVILIGASAGGLKPLQQIIGELPDQLKNTAIIIAQHTSPNYESMLVNLLKRTTQLEISEAVDGEKIFPNHIYTCPPDTDVRILNGKFNLTRPGVSIPKPSVDILFESAANTYGERVIGIIISGTGHDGSAGVISVKNAGGFTIAQDPETADYPGMPGSAILTDNIDLILPAKQIGKEIHKLLDKSYRDKILQENAQSMDRMFENDDLQKVLKLLHKKTGTDFSGYKASTINRRLEKRLSDKKYDTLSEYIDEIENNPAELDNLFLYLLIGVTQFFRNPESMLALADHLKTSLAKHATDQPYRVWIPGCATGEEAYSIAMILLDLLDNGSPKPNHIQIFATDIDQTPLTKARKGVYTADSLKTVPQKYLKKYFIKQGNDFVVTQEVKKHILFSKHDLTSNPPFLRLNLISCRNLLIYFKSPLQNQIIPLFHYTLEQDGILFLGASETIGRFKNLFATADIKHKIFNKKLNNNPISHIPLLQPLSRPKVHKTDQNVLKEVVTVPDMVKETFYNGYEHPYIVIDESLTILEINKDVSNYMKLPQGAPNYNAIKLIHEDLQLDLRTLIGTCQQSMSVCRGKFRKLRDREKAIVRLKVEPMIFSKPGSPFFIVSFESAEDNIISSSYLAEDHSGSVDPIITELEHELAATKEHLNTLVEELETSNEELQSLNEELQSSNEELQASNEELETSNEELQATNEELNVAYNELRSASNKLEEQSAVLSESQNNLKSLLDNNQQAFILIDESYKVILFNNQASQLFKELFNIKLWQGVNYIDILPSDYLQNFHNQFKETLQGKQTQFEEKITDAYNQQRYLAFNFTPVDSKRHKKISKVSLSFIDVTEKRNYELGMKAAYELADEERLLWHNIFQDSPELIAVYSGRSYEVSYINKSYQKLFPDRELAGKPIIESLPELKEQGFISLMDEVRRTGKPISRREVPFEVDYNEKDGVQTRYFNFTYRPIKEKDEDLPSIVVHAVDITAQVKKREKIEQERLFMQLISETLPEQIFVILPGRSIEFMNHSGLKFYGLDKIENLEDLAKKVHPDEHEDFFSHFETAFSDAQKFSMELRLSSGKNEWCWHMLNVRPMLSAAGTLLKLVASATDINQQKQSQKNKDDFMGVASHELKTPLTSVKAYTQLLIDHFEHTDDTQAKSYLQQTTKSVNKLEKFISDILDISRIQSGRLTLQKAEFLLNQMLKEVVDNLQVTSKSHQIKLQDMSDAIYVDADASRIEQVIINLINNAIKYSPKADKVVVILTQKLDYAEVAIQDFGVGIEEADLPNIFDRFYRVDEHKNKVAGMGIGLNISHEIIQLHDGELWAESAVDEGSIFYFTLPLSKNSK